MTAIFSIRDFVFSFQSETSLKKLNIGMSSFEKSLFSLSKMSIPLTLSFFSGALGKCFVNKSTIFSFPFAKTFNDLSSNSFLQNKIKCDEKGKEDKINK